MEYAFHIQGSAEEPYYVLFNYRKDKFRTRCDCPAGLKKQLCKHVTTILNGEVPEGIVHGEVEKIPNIVKAFNQSEAFEVYELYLGELEALEELKKQVSNRKKQFARTIYGR